MSGIINGKPSKSFFVNMITRDISIRDAILDLLDNSIDGASRIQPDDYSGLFINITIHKDYFILKDNCGGFSLDIAKNYAFRFGRPDDAVAPGGSVGRFGIGMKRSLFKMGESFMVESKTIDDNFIVRVDQDTWLGNREKITKENGEKEDVDNWDFDYEDVDGESENIDESGTFIKVEHLNREVSEQFNLESFLVSLEDDIERLLNFSLEKGITITLNGKNLSKTDIEIYMDNSMPYVYEGEHDGVSYKVIAGLGPTGEPYKAGWYVYCNNRLVVVANKNEVTGWDVGGVPRYTNDFAMFRGVVFFDSEETIKLPLTTTKKGVDVSSEIYRVVLRFMKTGMQEVISFLKDVRKLEDPNEYRKLLGEQTTRKCNIVEVKSEEFKTFNKFSPPILELEKLVVKKDVVRISYSVKKSQAEKVKRHNGAANFSQLGFSTYEYYIGMEELNNE